MIENKWEIASFILKTTLIEFYRQTCPYINYQSKYSNKLKLIKKVKFDERKNHENWIPGRFVHNESFCIRSHMLSFSILFRLNTKATFKIVATIKDQMLNPLMAVINNLDPQNFSFVSEMNALLCFYAKSLFSPFSSFSRCCCLAFSKANPLQ